ncbi:Ankyrin repeat domain-containing protein 2 [Hondaea fermentalgiana]|uniref:Ankyrin repeat domain-containing protein 2 n=1 Tax=Hondaea fermentalgiana TaxID=2315210 RepID=A0A2R5GB33_9STRA|nr:Ankyrin repeat domain-containing protein 2 [Hondaea fermentalgiana]|eukprot:GBG28216.1 Ankyrin repeat domain-containing protein 2 [Hondaea fermentalgiana]
MDTLRMGKEYKDDVLDEWRRRDARKRREWRELVERTRFDVKKTAQKCADYVRQFLSGEFGEPSYSEKRNFIFAAYQGDFHACKLYALKFGEVEGALDCQIEVDGKTALACASEKGHQRIVQLLVNRGADPDVRDRYGCTALHYACEAAEFECVELLLEAQADVDARNRFNVRPLMKAAEAGDPDIVDLLLEFAATPSHRDKLEKWTALHYAAKSGDTDCILSLLKAGCEYSKASSTGQTAQDIALDLRHKRAAIMLGKWRRRKLFPQGNKISAQALDELEWGFGPDD